MIVIVFFGLIACGALAVSVLAYTKKISDKDVAPSMTAAGSSVKTVANVPTGGTGQTSFANGELLIGNSSGALSKNVLQTNENLTITNGDGTIQIDLSKSLQNLDSVASQIVTVTGLTGAKSATRYAGSTQLGAPVDGSFSKGDFIIDHSGHVWICTADGSPGVWRQAGATTYETLTHAASTYQTQIDAAAALSSMNTALNAIPTVTTGMWPAQMVVETPNNTYTWFATNWRWVLFGSLVMMRCDQCFASNVVQVHDTSANIVSYDFLPYEIRSDCYVRDSLVLRSVSALGVESHTFQSAMFYMNSGSRGLQFLPTEHQMFDKWDSGAQTRWFIMPSTTIVYPR